MDEFCMFRLPYRIASSDWISRIQIHSIVQEKSVQGKIGFGVFLVKGISSLEISIKIVPMMIRDVEIYLVKQYREFEKHVEYLSGSPIWMEYYILQSCRRLEEEGKAVHVPHYYGGIFYMSSFSDELTNQFDLLNDPYFVFVSRKADFSLKNWILERVRTDAEWKSCIGQVVFAMITLQFHRGVVHNDLHWSNILVETREKKGVWRYEYQNRWYEISNEGYFFMPWDFGMASIYPDLRGRSDIESNIVCQDILQFFHFPKWIQKEDVHKLPSPWIQETCQSIIDKQPTSIREILEFLKDSFEYTLLSEEVCILKEIRISLEDRESESSS